MRIKVCGLMLMILTGCTIDASVGERFLPPVADVAILEGGQYISHSPSEIIFETSLVVLNTFYEGFDNDYLTLDNFQLTGPAGTYAVETFSADVVPGPSSASSTVLLVDQGGSYADTDPFNARAQAMNKFIRDFVTPNDFLIGASAWQGALSSEPLELSTTQFGNDLTASSHYLFDLGRRTGGVSAIFDAADEALDLLINNSGSVRKQLILLVHGNDLTSVATPASLIAKAQNSGVVIHVVALGAEADLSVYATVAEATGGLLAACPSDKQMVKVFTELERLINGPRFAYYLKVIFKPAEVLVEPGSDWLFKIEINDAYREEGYNAVPVKINIPS